MTSLRGQRPGGRWGALLLGLLVLVASPHVAWAIDPFESAPGPAPPASSPRPHYRSDHPRPPQAAPPQLQPYPALPVAPVAMPLDRIRQFAAVRNLPLPPDLQIVPPAADVPAEFARFSGVWGGDERWNGRGRQALFFGPPTPSTYNQTPERYWRIFGTIQGNSLAFRFGRGNSARLSIYDSERAFATLDPNTSLSPPFRGAKMWVSQLR
jgi:hypothetical protein